MEVWRVVSEKNIMSKKHHVQKTSCPKKKVLLLNSDINCKMSTRVYESVVLQAPIEKVWGLIRNLDLKTWIDTVKEVEFTGEAGEASL